MVVPDPQAPEESNALHPTLYAAIRTLLGPSLPSWGRLSKASSHFSSGFS